MQFGWLSRRCNACIPPQPSDRLFMPPLGQAMVFLHHLFIALPIPRNLAGATRADEMTRQY